MSKRLRTNSRRSTRGGGFTLSELMIALGIIAYGLTMSAGLFATAMQYNNQSFRSVVGTIICENGASVAITALRHDPGNPIGGSDELEDVTDKLELAERTYPAGSVDSDGDRTSRYGYCVLAKHIGDENDYQLTIVSYKLNKTGNTVELKKANNVNISDHNDASRASGIPAGVLPDSPLIRADTGELSSIEGIESKKAILRTRMESTSEAVKAWVIVESGNNIIAPTGLAAYTIRTALPEK
ncbi:MAG: prepilin-type N-terminal cleavage/methylation domain-containing protein [Phycisphaerae bacterium]